MPLKIKILDIVLAILALISFSFVIINILLCSLRFMKLNILGIIISIIVFVVSWIIVGINEKKYKK